MNILKDKLKPIYFKYLVAASGSSMVASIFGMVDAMMVGKYHGPAGNAALAVFNPVWSITFCFGLLAGIGGSVWFANSRGKGDEETAQQYFTASILYGILLSAVAVIGIGLFQDRMFRLFGADDELLVLTKQYLKPVLFALPCCMFTEILSSFLRNDGNPTLATKAVIGAGLFNAVGDYVCVFVLDMGAFGAGLATAIAQYIAVFIMLTHFLSKKNTLRLVKPVGLLRRMRDITSTGFSTAINDLSLGIIGVLFNRQIMAWHGSDALAIYGVITQITVFAQCLAYGAGQAAQPIISQNFGARQYNRIKECIRYGLGTCAVMGMFWTGAMMLVPNLFVNFFMNPTHAVVEIAPAILRIYGISYLLLPFNQFTTYYFQSIMQPRLSMVGSLARGAVVSGIMIMILPSLFGADALWYAMVVTELLVAVYGAGYMIRCSKELERS